MRLIIISCLLLAACSNAPSHLPNPLLLPIEAVKAGTANLIYGQKRAKVSRFVADNFDALRAEILNGGGPLERQAMELANVPAPRRFALHQELSGDPDLYFRADQEPLVVALMVHGNN